MKEYILIILFLLLSQYGYTQVYENKYVILNHKAYIREGKGMSSKVLRIVPKGRPMQVLEKLKKPFYIVAYKNAIGYYIGFNMPIFIEKNLGKSTSRHAVFNPPEKIYITLKQKVHIIYGYDYRTAKMVPRGETIQILEKRTNGGYLVKYKNIEGYCDLGKIYGDIDLLNKPSVKAENYKQNRNDVKKNDVVKNDAVKNYVKKKNTFDTRLPPILDISDISFSTNTLNAEQTETLSIIIKNTGPGDAKGVFVKLSGNISELEYPIKTTLPTIRANGGKEKISINIKGGLNLPTSEALIKIEIIEPNFKVKIQGKQLKFYTKEFQKPELIIAQFNLLENQSAVPNKQIDINEMIDLKFAVQNIGQGDADNVSIEVKNNQKGVLLLGIVEGNKLIRQNPNFSKIQSGKYKIIIYRYFVNSEFTGNQLQFHINSKERIGKFGFSETKSFPINKILKKTGFIRTISEADNYSKREIIIENIPNFVVDVDNDIPITKSKQTKTYALIIGNEDYKSRQIGLTIEQNVDFAINDAEVFTLYCEKTLGIPGNQIKLLKNATSAEIKRGLAWISRLSKLEKGTAKLIFYYSGHGLPHENTKEPYLIPVDVSGTDIEYGIKISDVYKKLSEFPAEQISVFLDACFSGGSRNQGLIAAKGIKVRPKKNIISGNMVVFTSSTDDESSAVYREKQHGFFTYYLLKKIKETKGEIEYNYLSNYLISTVSKEAGLRGKVQTPQVNVSPQVKNKWKLWKLK